MTNTNHYPLRGHNHTGGGFAAADQPVRRARYGPAPPASRVLRIAYATGLRPALDPRASATPWRSQPRAGTGLPPRNARHQTPRSKNPEDHNGGPTEPYYTRLEGPSGDAGMQKTSLQQTRGTSHGDHDRDKDYRSDDPTILAVFALARRATAAHYGGGYAGCDRPIERRALVVHGPAIGRRRWYHARCPLGPAS